MKKHVFLVAVFLNCLTALAQDSLSNAQGIGQAGRNQKVGRGFQVGFIGRNDTLLVNNKAIVLGSAGIGGAIINSAVLNLTSTTKGFKAPAMSTAQMLAISSPANGVMVFNTDSGKYYYFNSATWYQMGNTFTPNNGNGTTGGATYVDLGGTQTAPIAIVSDFTETPFSIGGAAGGFEFTQDEDDTTLSILYLQVNTMEVVDPNGLWSMKLYGNGVNENSGISVNSGRDTTYISFGTSNVFEFKNGRFFRGYAGFADGSKHISNIYTSKNVGGNDMSNLWCDYDTLTGKATAHMHIMIDSSSFNSLTWQLDNDGAKFYNDIDSVFMIDTLGGVTYGTLDSVSIYAITPTQTNKTFYCSNCTGNGVTGRLLSWIGGAWRRNPFE